MVKKLILFLIGFLYLGVVLYFIRYSYPLLGSEKSGYFSSSIDESEDNIIKEDTLIQRNNGISEDFWFPLPLSTNLSLVCDPQNPMTVQSARVFYDADFAINAGYFDENFVPVGYVKTQNKKWGKVESYPAFFGIENGSIVVAKSKKSQEEKFSIVVESFPLLVEDSKALFPRETNKYGNRTIIGKKNDVWGFYFLLDRPSLFEASNLLVEDGFSVALNLDGGSSTGFSGEAGEIFSAQVPCFFIGEKF